MAKTIWDFIVAHQTPISLFLAWNFSAMMSSLPPLDPKAGYFTRWIHDYLQLLAANLNKRNADIPPPMVAVPPSASELKP